VTLWFDSQRVGMATILAFFLVGLLLLLKVRPPERISGGNGGGR
jgi:MFS-type transporter involved in bile tolerance (Atg22 family)